MGVRLAITHSRLARVWYARQALRLTFNSSAGLGVEKMTVLNWYGNRDRISDLGKVVLIGSDTDNLIAQQNRDHGGVTQQFQRVNCVIDVPIHVDD